MILNGKVWSAMAPKFAFSRLASVLVAGASVAFASAQDSLSLEEALKLARAQNGTIQAAALDVQAARSRLNQARAGFLPTVTPDAGYTYRKQDVQTGLRSTFKTDDFTTGIQANWRLLDAGQRQFGFLSSRSNLRAQELNSLRTLRATLVRVHEAYFEVLRSRKLREVADSTVKRAQTTLDQVVRRIQVRDLAEKEELQARADLLNAEVNLLNAENGVNNAEASLRALIAWPEDRTLPALEDVSNPSAAEPEPLGKTLADGLAERPDLQARALQIEAADYGFKRALREAGVTWTVDANYEKRFGPTVQQTTNLTAVVSVPLYDGNRSKEAARELRLSRDASERDLEQARRDAGAEIESAYKAYTQAVRRLKASQLAFQAAKLNYEAADGSFRKGASDLLAVLTAQVSLVTAESNHIEAIYDTYVSEIRLRLATGKPIPGE